MAGEETKKERLSDIERYRDRLDRVKGFGGIYEIVKETVKRSLGEHRVGMMLFLDDMSLRLGAYHPLGTNNIILNRTLVQIVEATSKSRRIVNSFVYCILLHEYLHALGHTRESIVKPLVHRISRESFGDDHIATNLARKGPWSLLKGLPLDEVESPKLVMEIVKDFERADQGYIA